MDPKAGEVMPLLTFFFTPAGRWLAIGTVTLAIVVSIYAKGHYDGAANVQRKWDAAVQAAVERGEKARSDAESDVGRESPDRLRDDKFDRDKGAMRGVARHHVFLETRHREHSGPGPGA